MAALSYMQRRPSGIYEFRRRLPTELAGRVAPAHIAARLPDLVNPKTGCFKRELTVSLQTTDAAKAKRQDMAEALRFADMADLAVRLLKGAPVPEDDGSTAPTPAEIEADILSGLLKADEEEREQGDARRHLQTPADRALLPDLERVEFGTMGMQEDHFLVLGDSLRS